jgi:hypothetical protein
VKIRRGSWNEELFRVASPISREMLNPQMKGWGIYELYRRQAEQLRTETDGV